MKRNRDLAGSGHCYVGAKSLLAARLAAQFTRFKPARFMFVFLLVKAYAARSRFNGERR